MIASTLLGTRPPELPGRLLVRSGELFGIGEGATRVALSRMVAAGELENVPGGRYRLAGHLLERQARQDASRRPPFQPWDGRWRTAVVTAGGRRPADRATLRTAMRTARMAELREGVWMRPDNLAPATVFPAHATWLLARPADGDDLRLAGSLWNLHEWDATAAALLAAMTASVGRLRSGQLEQLRPSFILAAAVLRHLTADPLLPERLLPTGWRGTPLRRAYDDYEAALQGSLRQWYRTQR